MAAPAGLGRIGTLQIETAGEYAGDNGSVCAAAALPLGTNGFTAGAGAGWNGTENSGIFQISTCYVVTGDPIGFMEGLYGPSVTTGASASYEYNDSTDSSEISLDCGFQFSLFPSFALGVNCTDATGDAIFKTGFSHVFNRNLKVHVNYGDETWQGGAELTVKPSLRIISGTDGSSFSGGLLYTFNRWTAGYSARFFETSIEHSLGFSGRFP